jgi:predicted DNA-binding transcriptional regulator YafY
MRAERLISLMLLLHSKGGMTAHKLAEYLEVSERTIYRDLDALSEANIPIYTHPGPNGGVFLDEDYRVSLTGLSRDELQALFIASDAYPLRELGLGRAVEDALLKLFAALPSVQRPDIERLRDRLYIDPVNWFHESEWTPTIPLLQQAIWEGRRIHMLYQSFTHEITERTIEPYALVAKANVWYMVGRQPGGDMRNYRNSRIQQVRLLDETFERADFDLIAYWQESRISFEKHMAASYHPYPATVRIQPDVMDYFGRYLNGRYEILPSAGDDEWLRLHVTFESTGEAKTCILGLGTKIDILEPDDLRQMVIQAAREIVAFHSERK